MGRGCVKKHCDYVIVCMWRSDCREGRARFHVLAFELWGRKLRGEAVPNIIGKLRNCRDIAKHMLSAVLGPLASEECGKRGAGGETESIGRMRYTGVIVLKACLEKKYVNTVIHHLKMVVTQSDSRFIILHCCSSGIAVIDDVCSLCRWKGVPECLECGTCTIGGLASTCAGGAVRNVSLCRVGVCQASWPYPSESL